jgi:hypothetical protein
MNSWICSNSNLGDEWTLRTNPKDKRREPSRKSTEYEWFRFWFILETWTKKKYLHQLHVGWDVVEGHRVVDGTVLNRDSNV